MFLVFDGTKMLDVTGPAEVFAEAKRAGADYELIYVSPTGRPVLTSIGVTLAVDAAVDEAEERGDAIDTVIVSGGDDLPLRPIAPDLIEAALVLHGRCRRMVSICTGSFVLGAAGLLKGRRATTHWRYADLLKRAYPETDVAVDALFVKDSGVYTSAGVSAGIDLALALIEEDHGPELAREIARNLVMFMRRPGGQSQFAAPLEIKPPRTSTLRLAIDLVAAQPALEHSTTSLARHVGLSTRQLSRLFTAELDTTPAKFVERTRLDHAKSLLDSGHGVAQTARLVGFGSAETMRRLFVSRFGISPSEYRARFNRVAPPDVTVPVAG